MQTYSEQIKKLLKRFVGKSNVLHENYQQITLETKVLSRNVKTEKDFDLFFDKVMKTPLP